MSVTFRIEGNPTGMFTAECYETNETFGPIEGHRNILTVLDQHKKVCDECAAYGIYTTLVMDVPDHLDVNLANGNARWVLALLGLDTDGLFGSMHGEIFLGRVLMSMAADHDDTGVKDAVVGGPLVGQTGATLVECGVPAGYLADRLGQLHALALEAHRLGRDVVWG